MSKRIYTAVLGLGFALSAAAADAPQPNATLDQIEGKGHVSVNRGEEYTPGAEGMRLKAGDRVMVQDDSKAEIKFDDECEYAIEENKIVTIPDKSPCAGGVPLVQALNPAGGSAIGAGATGTGNGGVAAMAGIVAAIDIWWLNEDDNDTASP